MAPIAGYWKPSVYLWCQEVEGCIACRSVVTTSSRTLPCMYIVQDCLSQNNAIDVALFHFDWFDLL